MLEGLLRDARGDLRPEAAEERVLVRHERAPVFSTLARTVSMSSGTIVRRSITSTETSRRDIASAASRDRLTSAPQVTMVRSLPSRATRASPHGRRKSSSGSGEAA